MPRRNINLYYIFSFFQDFALVYPVYVIYFRAVGLDFLEVSWLLAIWGVPVLVMEIPSGVAADLWSRKWALVVGMVLKAAGFVVWLVRPDFVGFALGFMLWGLQEGICTGTTDALLYDALRDSGKEERFVEVSGRGAMLARAGIIASVLIGGLVFNISESLVMIASAGSMLVAAAAAAGFDEPRTTAAGAKGVQAGPGHELGPGYDSAPGGGRGAGCKLGAGDGRTPGGGRGAGRKLGAGDERTAEDTLRHRGPGSGVGHDLVPGYDSAPGGGRGAVRDPAPARGREAVSDATGTRSGESHTAISPGLRLEFTDGLRRIGDSVRTAAAVRGMLAVVFFGSLAVVVYGVLDEYDFLFGHHHGVPVAYVGIWGATRFLFEGLGASLAYRLETRLSLSSPVRLAVWMGGAGILLLASVASGTHVLLVLYFLFYCMMAAAEILFHGWIQHRIESAGRATVASLVSFLYEAFGLLVVLLLGAISQWYGLPELFLAGAVLVLLAAALFAIAVRSLQRIESQAAGADHSAGSGAS